MLISDAMNKKLNEQIAAEFMAAHKYLAMSCVLESMGLKVLRRRFFDQYREECEHALKFLNYVTEVGGTVELAAIEKPRSGYESVEQIVETALASEHEVTRLVNEITALAEKENDFATRSFINWFIDEQVEEVSSMTDLLQLVRLAKGNMLQVEARVRHEMMSAKN